MSSYDPYSGEPVPADYSSSTTVEPVEQAEPEPARRGRRKRPLGMAAKVGIFLLFVAPLMYVSLKAKADRDDPPPRTPVLDSIPKPEYVETAPVRVVGPVWASNENTYTMQVGHWPFAFKTHPDWDCFGGQHEDFPGEQIEVCIGAKGQQLALMLRDCPGECTARERRRMDREVLTTPAKARKLDRGTVYTQRTSGKKYIVELSRFIVEDGQPRQLNVVAEAPVATRDVVLKAFNDVVGQTQRMRG